MNQAGYDISILMKHTCKLNTHSDGANAANYTLDACREGSGLAAMIVRSWIGPCLRTKKKKKQVLQMAGSAHKTQRQQSQQKLLKPRKS